MQIFTFRVWERAEWHVSLLPVPPGETLRELAKASVQSLPSRAVSLKEGIITQQETCDKSLNIFKGNAWTP